MENLGRYSIRASFSQERMTYFPEDSKVVYRSKDGKEEKILDALEWPRRKSGCTRTMSKEAVMRFHSWKLQSNCSLNPKIHRHDGTSCAGSVNRTFEQIDTA